VGDFFQLVPFHTPLLLFHKIPAHPEYLGAWKDVGLAVLSTLALVADHEIVEASRCRDVPGLDALVVLHIVYHIIG